MKTRPAICARKRRFRVREDAYAAVASAQVRLNIYRCPLCRDWHLTSRTKGMWQPRGPAG